MSGASNIPVLLRKIGQIHNTAITDYVGTLQRVLRTLLEMINDRRYTSIVHVCRTVDEIEDAIRNASAIVTAQNEAGGQLQVYFSADDKVGVRQLRAWTEECVNDQLVIVSLDGPTAFTRKATEQLAAPVVHYFQFRDVSVNITRHSLVPRHRRVDRVPQINHVDIQACDLPKLLVSDRVCQYYAFRVGDIIEVTRHCGSQQEYKYYRLVVDAGL